MESQVCHCIRSSITRICEVCRVKTCVLLTSLTTVIDIIIIVHLCYNIVIVFADCVMDSVSCRATYS